MPTREQILAWAESRHDDACSCDRRYRMSCPVMAQTILNYPKEAPLKRWPLADEEEDADGGV